jgi:UDP-glucose 4-epimerase
MNNKVTIIFGGAGFIGNTLIDRLLSASNNHIVVVDNLSNGELNNLNSHFSKKKFHFLKKDCSKINECNDVFVLASGLGQIVDIWHLAANSDISLGTQNPAIDLKDTFLTTFEIMNQIKIFGVNNFYFASSSAIYGDHGISPIGETTGPLLPISNYGAMKLASEAFISASAERIGFSAILFRFPNVVGAPATHGIIYDFLKKLKQNPKILRVLGNGSQKKIYLHVSDLVDAMLFIASINKNAGTSPFNIGPIDQGVTVKCIAEKVVRKVSIGSKIIYGDEPRGWIGDVPAFNYCIDKVLNLGWRPKKTSDEAIDIAILEIIEQLEMN